MNEMVEYIATVISNALFSERAMQDTSRGVNDQCRDAARDAIAAMRTATTAMLEAGANAHPSGGYHNGTTLQDIIEAEWIAMVDEALR